MKTPRLFAFLAVLATLSISAQTTEPAAPADTDTETASPSENAESAKATEDEALAAEQRAELNRELFELQKEIRAARQEAAKSEDVQEIRKQIAELSAKEQPDRKAILDLNAEARRLTERHLAEIPGMTEKLARLMEVGNLLRKDLPAEQRRKGPRLPRKPPVSEPAPPEPAAR